MTRYDYKELREKALSADATQADLEALASWLNNYDIRAWNGESWDIDDGLRLFPLYAEAATAPDDFEIVGYEIR